MQFSTTTYPGCLRVSDASEMSVKKKGVSEVSEMSVKKIQNRKMSVKNKMSK